MALAETALLSQARTAYERGRVVAGLRSAIVVAPMAAASWVVCDRPAATAAGAILLATVVTACVWRGGTWARGARLGLWAGLPPLVLPLSALLAGHVCGASFCAYYPGLCLVGGVLGGALVTWLAPRHAASPAAAAAVAILAGTLGCLVAGVTGIVVLVGGLILAASPALVAQRA